MSPNLPPTCLWPINQLLLSPVKQLTPPQLAFFGVTVTAIRSTPLMRPSYRFYLILAWDPTRKADMRKALGAGIATALLGGAPAGRAQVSQFAGILV